MLAALALGLVRLGAWLLAKRARGEVAVTLDLYDHYADAVPAVTIYRSYGA